MNKAKSFDPITLEVMRNAFYSIADEMIVALIRASYSTNIKDRRDTSCAIYTATGDVVVVAPVNGVDHGEATTLRARMCGARSLVGGQRGNLRRCLPRKLAG